MHITHVCPRFKEIHGGGEPVVLHLLDELEAIGIENTLCTYNFPQSMRPLLNKNVDLTELPALFNRSFKNPLLAGLFDLSATLFYTLLIPRKTDAVCFHMEGVVPALLLYTLFKKRKPAVYFCFQPPRFAYDTTSETIRAGGALGTFVPFFKSMYRPFDRAGVRRADAIATFSNGYGDWIRDIYKIQDVNVIPPGAKIPSVIPPLPESIRVPLSQPESAALVCVGKLLTWKNIDRLIRVTGILKAEFSGIRLLVVGDGPCMNSLVAQAKASGLEDTVIFCGYQTEENVFSYCAASDLMVLLEHNASFGLALVEANAMGIPVMAFEGGGPSDIIVDGKNGFLLDNDATDSEIAERIAGYLRDRTNREQMKKHALNAAGRYTWANFARGFADLARTVLG